MPSMTPTQAGHARRNTLQSAVDTGARCAGPGALEPDDFFREDREPIGSWRLRAADAIDFCHGCPAMNACRELALRDGDGRPETDELVRGGLGGQVLFALRNRESQRLTAAITADRDTEWERLTSRSAKLRRTALVSPDKAGGNRQSGRAQAAQNEAVRDLAAEVRQIQRARRARAGWGTAA